MRNSLALLGIPDLPIYAFRHVGDRRIQPQGGGTGIPVLDEIIEAPAKLVEKASDAAADLDDTVNKEIPGGWATVVNVATAGQAAPYTSAAQAAVALDKGASLEDVAKNYAISQAAGQVSSGVGAETGSSLAGNVAGGTTAGLLSGKSLEESVKGGVISGGVSQVTPSTLFTPSTSATTGANNMADYFDYPQFDTGESVSGYYGNPTDFNSGESVSGYYGNAADFGGGESVSGFYGGQDLQNSLDSIYNPNLLQQLTPALRAGLQKALMAGGSAAQTARNYLSSMGGGMNANLLQGGAGTAAQLMQLQANREAAQQAQARIGQATQQAVAGAQFRPVGTTTRFGTSNFQVDPTTGQLTSAGYTAAPEITSAQNRLMSLGSSYLAQTPEEVAQQYMTRQYDLLDPSRQRQLAGIRNQQFQTGRGGLSVGSTGLRPSGAQGLMGSNPELEAYYNALAQQDAQLAAQAQQAGQQQVSFGTGLFGQAGQLEQLAQQPFNLSQGLAEKSSLGGARAGSLGIQGNVYGNAIGLSAANTTNPFATVLGGLSSPTSLLSQGIGTWLNAPQTNANIATGNAFMAGSNYSV